MLRGNVLRSFRASPREVFLNRHICYHVFNYDKLYFCVCCIKTHKLLVHSLTVTKSGGRASMIVWRLAINVQFVRPLFSITLDCSFGRFVIKLSACFGFALTCKRKSPLLNVICQGLLDSSLTRH